MYKIIGGDDREYGPVAAAQIEQWIAQRRANARTRVQPAGTTDWVPLGQIPEFASALGLHAVPPPLPEPPPVPSADAMGATVSPAPDAIPAENAAPLPADPREAALACADRPYELSVSGLISQGWALLTRQFWLCVGGTTLVVAVSSLVGAIPYAGPVLLLLFTLVPIAGIYWMMLRANRGEPAGAADLLAGFQRALRPLVLLTVILTLATRVLALVALGPLLWQLHRQGLLAGEELLQVAVGGDPFSELVALFAGSGHLPDFTALTSSLLALPLLAIPLAYFSTAWTFAPLLVIDRGLGPIEALALSRRVAHRRWFRLFFLNLALIPLLIAGAFCFIVGIFVVLALSLACYVVAYETAFGPAPGRRAAAPDDQP